MNIEKQIEEMGKLCPFYEEGKCNLLEDEATECNFDCDMCDFATNLYNADYRKQSEVELRVETTTDDFKDLEVAKERGYHRKKFYCPNCDLLIKRESWDSKRMFGSGTILKSNEMPKFCPECGAKMKGE